MTNASLAQSVVIMTGMHRSGTSLTASLLASAGIDFGDRLLSEDDGNPKGHFEDLDFLEFQIQVLRSQNETDAGWTESNKLQVQQQHWSEAKDLIAARQDKPIWGWKDPRTTLFLEFWSELIPNAKYIFVYRSPWEVVDSLFRRGDVIFRQNPALVIPQWCSYNQAILDFYQSHREQSLLLEVSSVIQYPQEIVELVNQKFGLELRSPKDLYEKALFTKDLDLYRQVLVSKFLPQAVDLYNQLQEQADRRSVSQDQDQTASSDYGSKILQDWQASTEKHRLETALAESAKQRELDSQKSQKQLQIAQSKFEQQLQIAQKKSQLQLQAADKKFQQQLQIAGKEKDKLVQLIVAMETSKFWQIRQNWFDFKRKIGIRSSDLLYQNYSYSQRKESLANKLIDGDSNEAADDLPKYLKVLRRNLPFKTLLKKAGRKIRSRLSYRYAVLIDKPIKSNDFQYQKWLQQNYLQPEDFDKIKSQVSTLAYQPLISVIVPVYNPDENFLRQAIASVMVQAYQNWELCLADDLSTKAYVKEILAEYAAKDSRLKVVFRQENGHISRASNSALEVATGEYIALLDHDDLLAPHALAEVVKLLNQHPEADFIYSDEDKIDEYNIHRDPLL